jgi:hypothetical protein
MKKTPPDGEVCKRAGREARYAACKPCRSASGRRQQGMKADRPSACIATLTLPDVASTRRASARETVTTRKTPRERGAYIFFIDEHFTNLPCASRQGLAFIFIGAGHFINFPCASRHDFAEAIPQFNPPMTITASAVATIRNITTPKGRAREGKVARFFPKPHIPANGLNLERPIAHRPSSRAAACVIVIASRPPCSESHP